MSFRIGREYMVYASRSDAADALATSVCSRTRPIEDAAADMSYVRALKNGTAPAGVVGGHLSLARVDLNGRAGRPPQPLPGITVRVAKDNSTEPVVTNQGGDFSILHRGVGVYAVSVDVPGEYYTKDPVREVHIADPLSCGHVDVVLYDNGLVSGRIIDATGRAVPGLTLELATTDLRQNRRTITDRDGRFEIARLPPGRLVVNSGIGKLTPLAQVTVGAGAKVPLDDLRLPPAPSYVALSGFVLRPDGTPAEGARVYLKGVDGNEKILSEPATVDFLGRFVIAGLAGTDYQLFAELAAQHHVESSDQMLLTAAAGARPLRLVVRRRY
jgi:Carboxypeptidase regulatory-like domain